MKAKKMRRDDWKKWMVLLMVCVGLYFIPASPEAKEILIGINTDVTGVMAPVGRTESDCALWAIEEWNAKGGIKGQKIQSVFMNNGADPVRATGNARALVDKGVCAVHGGTYSTAAIAEMKVLAPAKIPMMGNACATVLFQEGVGPDGKNYFFTGYGADVHLVRGYLDIPAKAGYKKAAILYLNVAWPKDLMAVAKELVQKEYGPKYGMSIVGTVEADIKASDLSLQINQVKAMNPDIMIAIIYQPNAIAVTRALADARWNPPWVAGWGQADDVYDKSSDKKLYYNLHGVSYYSGLRPDAVAKREAFIKKYGYVPTSHWAPAYDLTNVLLRAIDAVGPEPVAIRDWLATKSNGIPLLCGVEGMTCKIRDVEETVIGKRGFYYSLFDGTDYAPVWVDKEGKLDWKKLVRK